MTPLTTKQAAAALGVTPRTIRKWCSNGTLAATQLGRDWLIESAEIERQKAHMQTEAYQPQGGAGTHKRDTE